MRTATVPIVELFPDEGNWLTQAQLKDESERIFSEKVFCKASLVDTWTEWTNEEKEQWEAEHPIDEPEAEPEGENTEGIDHAQ